MRTAECPRPALTSRVVPSLPNHIDRPSLPPTVTSRNDDSVTCDLGARYVADHDRSARGLNEMFDCLLASMR